MPALQETDLRATFPIDKQVKSEAIVFALSQARLFTIGALTRTVYDDVIAEPPTDATRSEAVRNAMLKLAYAHLIEQNAFRLNHTGVLHRQLDASAAIGNNITNEYQRIEDVKNFAESLGNEARKEIRAYVTDDPVNRTQFRRLVRA